MPSQESESIRPRQRDDVVEAEEAPASTSSARGDELDADVDAILDEIDEVLEVNAEDFVKSFVQKGGQ